MVDELARDVSKLRRLEHQIQELRKSIRSRVLDELRSGVLQSDIAHRTGWSRETIRKIERRGDGGGGGGL